MQNFKEKISKFQIRQKLKTAKSVAIKTALIFLLSSTALSTILQLCPNLTSQSFDDYMKSKGYADNLSEHFHAANIRVYNRGNYLIPWKAAGDRVIETVWHRNFFADPKHPVDASNPKAILLKAPLALLGYALALPMQINVALSSSPLDVYTIRGSRPLQDRNVFIHPPGDISAEEYVTSFIPIQVRASLQFKNDPEEIRKIFLEYVMLHEARHGDQNDQIFEVRNAFADFRSDGAKEVSESTNESDADLYAFKILQARGTNPAALEEALTIMRHVRTLVSVMCNEPSHSTSPVLKRGEQSLLEGITDELDFARLYKVLDQAYRLNKGNMMAKGDERHSDEWVKRRALVNLSILASKEGLFKNDSGLEKASAAFVEAATYISGLYDKSLTKVDLDKLKANEKLTKEELVAAKGMFNENLDMSKVDLSLLTKEYKPVPDKLEVPPQKPSGAVVKRQGAPKL